MSNRISVENYEGETLTCRAKWEICDRCEGSGTHDHPAFSNGLSQDDFDGPDADPDFREDYFSGKYDVRCEECHGSGKVLAPDSDDPSAKAVINFLREQAEAQYEIRMAYEAEARFGA